MHYIISLNSKLKRRKVKERKIHRTKRLENNTHTHTHTHTASRSFREEEEEKEKEEEEEEREEELKAN